MSTNFRSANPSSTDLDGSGLHIAVVCGRFNDLITDRLLDGAAEGMAKLGVRDDDVELAWVPGAFEIPVAARAYAATGRVDAVITLGAVIRGETAHFEYVAGQCAEGVQRVQLDLGVPVAFGVLTTENLDQALARSEPESEGHNVGRECAHVAVEMADLLRRIREHQ
ncbi:MAG: 6,7-dimethyl-8-ribityllumazine synthase [Actinobacteria bacterium]|nr:6,7-dimethyl-8-ribityllumazine synthase [Actinomycetota bacterium]